MLFGEDGTRLFMHYGQNRGVAALFQESGGHVSFGSNLIGWLIGSLPVTVQPYWQDDASDRASERVFDDGDRRIVIRRR